MSEHLTDLVMSRILKRLPGMPSGSRNVIKAELKLGFERKTGKEKSEVQNLARRFKKQHYTRSGWSSELAKRTHRVMIELDTLEAFAVLIDSEVKDLRPTDSSASQEKNDGE